MLFQNREFDSLESVEDRARNVEKIEAKTERLGHLDAVHEHMARYTSGHV